MKIGILTASRTDNNGTDLQAYAMQIIFKKHFENVELINYVCKKIDSSILLYRGINLKKIIRFPLDIYIHINHLLFRKRFLNLSPKCDVINYKQYDTIVVGSDQIWNLDITNDINYYLPNSNGLKFSYAASFGKDQLKKFNTNYDIYNLLKKFNSVSVREKENIKELQMNGISSREDLDPILMLSKEEWIESLNIREKKKKYILLYLAEESRDSIDLAVKLSKKYNLDVIYCTNRIRRIKGIKIRNFVGIKRWLQYVYNADLILTNSYHCLSFSILFNKNVIITKLGSKVSNITRLTDIIKKVCKIDNINLKDGHYEMVDVNWNEVNKNIDYLRNKSFDYINNIYKEGNKNERAIKKI